MPEVLDCLVKKAERRAAELCEDIAERSGAMEAVINLIYDPVKEQEYIREQERKRKEKSNDEHIR